MHTLFTGTFTNKNLNVALQTICTPLAIQFVIKKDEVMLFEK
jgi:hypothetical protein